MPIRPEMRPRYPPDWPQISRRIRFELAIGRCECDGRCGRRHSGRCTAEHGQPHPATGSRVVLTVAHLDDIPEHCDDDNLAAMCQACHLAYDVELHATTAARTRALARISPDQQVLFPEGELP
ncbi:MULTISPECIES: hypothetical protein [Streptomyces]|uniref:hypothetical protein n=1 Tax=Streptomyces lycopersici TaxID=2974589 RepID=UPI0021D1F24C|nr:hypothetical protein [Streptomyces sp. NEAU-383]